MKYQALRPHFFSVGGLLEGSWCGLVGGGGMGGSMGGGVVGEWGVGLVVRGWGDEVGGLVGGKGWGGWVNIMKDLKYEHESIFPLWGRVKLNFRDR